jgi:HAD superfamily hydrolase (TIGR01459 family)
MWKPSVARSVSYDPANAMDQLSGLTREAAQPKRHPMSQLPHIVSSLRDIHPRYDSVLCDVWGVIHNGRAAFSQATTALARFRQQGGTVIMLTNAPRPSSEIPAQFEALGVPDDCWDKIITSGDATRALLTQHAPGPVYKLGPDKDDRLYRGTGLNFSSISEARLISCTGLFDDNAETPDDYTQLLGEAAARKLPMICANPDLVVRFGDRMIYCAGALAKLYFELGGKVVFGGKPHAPIYELCYAVLKVMQGKAVDRHRILAIGDGLQTDVQGAAGQALDCLFISGGIHGAQMAGHAYEEEVFALLQQNQTRARYAMPDLC